MLGQMLHSLWIDTSGVYCSLGLQVGEQEFCETRRLDRTHNKNLLPLLEELFREAGIRPLDLDVIGFACGPGSFTGVRMSAAAVQALAAAASCRVVPVQTNRALFLSAGVSENTVCAIRSRGDAYYLSLPDGLENELHDACPTWVNEEVQLLGERPNWWPTEREPEVVHSDPRILLSYIVEQFENGSSVTAEMALPVYFSGDSPWRKQNA